MPEPIQNALLTLAFLACGVIRLRMAVSVITMSSTELMSCRGVPLVYRAKMFLEAKLREPSNRPSRSEAR